MQPTALPAVRIALERADQPDVLALLRDAETYSAALYPAESNHHLPPDALCRPEVAFYVARDTAGRAVATGALVAQGDWGEVKCMWVAPDARGRGISRAVLEALEADARARGLSMLRLETGVDSHAALALYDRCGYARRGPFADYRPDPLSVFMEKTI